MSELVRSEDIEKAQDTGRRLGPTMKPGQSRQDYATPWELIRAVEKRWGSLSWDLAATAENHRAPRFITSEQDTFTVAWHKLDGLLWLNPEFGKITRWVKKCAEEAALGAKIIALSPASVGSEWFADYVEGRAFVAPLRPRLVFEGQKDPYPKDCMLSLFNIDLPGFESWRWDEEVKDESVVLDTSLAEYGL